MIRGVISFAATGFALVLVYLLGDKDLYLGVLGAGLTVAVILTMLIEVRMRQRLGTHAVPLLSCIAGVYWLYFALPVFITSEWFTYRISVSVSDVARALEYALLGWLMIAIGYLCIGRFRPFGRYNIAMSPRHSLILALILVTVGIGASAIPRSMISVSLAQIIRLLSDFLTLGLGILLSLSLRKDYSNAIFQRTLWLLVIPVFLFSRMLSGSVSNLVFPAVVFIFVFFYVRRSIPWAPLVVVALVTVLVRPVIDQYRELVWYQGPHTDASAVEKAGLLSRVVADSIVGEAAVSNTFRAEKMAERTNHLALFARVVELTPSSVPFWHGVTYTSVLTAYVPRILWPNKPTAELGQGFGHRYGFISRADRWTSVNLPQLVESYANFGFGGVLLVMLGIGMLYRLLVNYMDGASDVTQVFAAFVFSKTLAMESDFSLVFGWILQILIVYYIIKQLSRISWRLAI